MTKTLYALAVAALLAASVPAFAQTEKVISDVTVLRSDGQLCTKRCVMNSQTGQYCTEYCRPVH